MIGGRYRLLRLIGRGGMGEVFLAQDEVLGREVAVKHILPGDEDQLTATQRLLREARSAARIHHPNVVTVHDLVVEDQDAYIVMEYVAAENLAQILRRGPINPERAARIGAQVADALAAAHALGIVHRDVKPSNILVSTGDATKLMDFGVARIAGDTGLTRTGHMIGSIAYMPPEIARGSDATPAADLYSLGATLFTAVEGHPPFAADDESSTSVAMLVRLVTESAPTPTRAGAITAVISSLLAADPAARPTATGTGDALRAATATAADAPTSSTAPVADEVEDDEASIETRIRPAVAPPHPAEPVVPEPAAPEAAILGTPAAGMPAPDKDDAEDSLTRVRPSQIEREKPSPAVPPHPLLANSTPAPAVASIAARPHPAPEVPASPEPGIPVAKPMPMTPNQKRRRQRRKILAFAGVAVLALGSVAALTIPPTQPATYLAEAAPAVSATPTTAALPTPASSSSAFSYKTYVTGLNEWDCEGDGLTSIEAEADGTNLTVTVHLEKSLRTDDDYLTVDVYLDDGDEYWLSVYDGYADELYDPQKEKEIGSVEAWADGKTVFAMIPLSKMKPKGPVAVDAELGRGGDDSSCGLWYVT